MESVAVTGGLYQGLLGTIKKLQMAAKQILAMRERSF